MVCLAIFWRMKSISTISQVLATSQIFGYETRCNLAGCELELFADRVEVTGKVRMRRSFGFLAVLLGERRHGLGRRGECRREDQLEKSIARRQEGKMESTTKD